MDDDVSGVGSTLTPKQLEKLRALAWIRQDVVMDVVARKRRVTAVEADVADIKATVGSLTGRVLRAIGQRDQRDEERPA